MAAHLYWRVRAIALQGSTTNFALSEVDMRVTAGGANQCTGGTPLASSQFDNTIGGTGHAKENAFDGNINTKWATANSTIGQMWIGYQFATAKDIVEIVLTSRNDATVNQSPASFLLEYSDDGVTWVISKMVTGIAAWPTGTARTYNVAALAAPPATRWCVLGVTTQDGGVNLAWSEVDMRSSIGGANLCTGGTALFSSQFDATVGTTGHAGVNAFDGNINTRWASASAPPASTGCAWIGYQFAAAQTIVQVALTARNDANFGQAGKSFWVLFSHDGTTWEPAISGDEPFVANPWSTGSQQLFADTSEVSITKGTLQVISHPIDGLAIIKGTLQVVSGLSQVLSISKGTLQVISGYTPAILISKGTVQVISAPADDTDNEPTICILW